MLSKYIRLSGGPWWMFSKDEKGNFTNPMHPAIYILVIKTNQYMMLEGRIAQRVVKMLYDEERLNHM
jgi:hypothetical protein